MQKVILELKLPKSIAGRLECVDFVLHNVEVAIVDKILKNRDVASGIDQISTKFLKDSAPVIVTHLANIVNLLIKLYAFPRCKTPKIKHFLEKGIKTEAKLHTYFYNALNVKGNDVFNTKIMVIKRK